RRGLSIVIVGLFTAQSFFAGVGDGAVTRPAAASSMGSGAAAYSSAGGVEARPTLDQVTDLSSWEIAQWAEKVAFDPQEIKLKTDALEKELKQREEQFKSESKAAEKRIEAQKSELRELRQDIKDPTTVHKRKQIQCEIAGIKKDLTDRALAFLEAQNTTDVQI